jgi:error-prone DNA polymerase
MSFGANDALVALPLLHARQNGPTDWVDVRYAELHCKSNFSFLEGASHADELAAQAAALGYAALAVTDRNSLAGVVRAHLAAKESGLKLIVGAEITPVDAPPVVLWASDRRAYGRLSRLITAGRRRAPKGKCHVTLQDVAEHAEGLLAGVVVDPEAAEEVKAAGTVSVRGETTPTSLLVGEADSQASRQPAQNTPLPFRPPQRGGRNGSGKRGYEERNSSSRISFTHEQARGGLEKDSRHLPHYRDIFGDRCYLLAELHRGPNDERRLQRYVELSRETRIPLVAAGDVHYHIPGRMVLQHTMTAIRHGITVAEAGERLFSNAQRHLRPVEEIAALFANAPDSLHRTIEIADRCSFSLDELKYEYPEELAPEGMRPIEYLKQLAWRGAKKRYPQGVPPKVQKLLAHELRLIEELHYEAYFLTVFDLVRFARHRGILCQGRGSAANSVVCFCLGVTSVDPERIDVLFERFVSRERNEAPDIDVDFEHERREEVLQYLYEKYGRERAGMTATVIAYRTRSAVRDVGKALGLSLDRVDRLAKLVEGYHHEPNLPDRCRQAGIDPDSEVGQRLVYLVNELVGFPRHLSQHVGGMVITQGPLCELAPIENAAMEDRTVIEWDKDDLDELGILKVDCLSLGMLTAIRKCFEMIRETEGRELTLAAIPPEDPAMYEMIQRADTMGVFQIESRAQMAMLPRLKPRTWYDLVIEVAIVRPGPIQGDMVHPYLRRRAGLEPVTYPNQAIREVLCKTLGVPLFQEQAMRLAVVAAGFTPGEADQLRRAMGAWRRPGVIDAFRKKLLDGMTARGLSPKFAEQVFNQIRGFGEYGFPESHAASFASLVYVSAWLKHYYPAAFAASILNSQPMGFYAPAQLVQDARQHGVAVLPVDVNESEWDSTLEMRIAECGMPNEGEAGSAEREMRSEENPGDVENSNEKSRHSAFRIPHSAFALRLGFRLLTGFAQRHSLVIEEARRSGPFRSVEDFTRRTRLGKSTVAKLAEADAFASCGADRRLALWDALAQEKAPKERTLFDEMDVQEEAPALPALAPEEQVFADYRAAGLSLKGHPLEFYRERLNQLGVVPIKQLEQLQHNRVVRVGGLVVLRQRPSTAKGITFVTLEDETGAANLVVFHQIWQQFYRIVRASPAWIVQGRLEKEGNVIHVIVSRVEDLGEKLRELKIKSRDFR